MGASTTPHQIPVFREDMFEFAGEEMPRHANRLPTQFAVDNEENNPRNRDGTWGLQSILAPHVEGTTIIAANIVDEDVLHGLVLARFRKLALEYPPADGYFNGDEVQILLPRAGLEPGYREGVEKMRETAVSLGGAANLGPAVGLQPVPLAA